MQQLFDYTLTDPIGLICAALCFGVIAAAVSAKFLMENKSLTMALVMLPPLVCAALLAINGNVGASIGVLGVFGLVRFRSAPCTAKDLVAIFFAMTVGLVTATGKLFTAFAITLIISVIIIIAALFILRKSADDYMLKILLPEQMNIENAFGEILSVYFEKCELERLKTTNMGAMFELSYRVIPKKDMDIQKMMDDIRSRNGNLTVAYYRYRSETESI